MNTFDAIYQRRAVKHYGPAHEFTDDEVNKLMQAAIQSPTLRLQVFNCSG